MKFRFVFKRGHPNWRAVCKALGAEFIQIKDPNNNLILRKFFISIQMPITIISSFLRSLFLRRKDGVVYILSGIQPIFLPIMMRKFKGENNKIIVIVNDASFYLNNKSRFMKRLYKKYLFSNVDGAIAISPLVKEMAEKYVRDVKYVMDPIWRGHSYFSKNKPNFDSNDFIHVGKFQMIKGIDLTAKTMKKADNELGSKTFILGNGIEKGLKRLGLFDRSFIFPGYDDPLKYFSKVKFYIQIARLEAGGTAVLEAMAAGIIPFVNNRVGHSNIVARVDKRLVVSSSPEKAAKEIINFIETTPKEKIIKLSRKCREITKSNDLKYITKDFKNALNELIKNV